MVLATVRSWADLKNMGVRNCRRKLQVREQWMTSLEGAKMHQGL